MKTREEIEEAIGLIEVLIKSLESRPDNFFASLIKQKKGEIQALRWVLGEWKTYGGSEAPVESDK